MIPPRKRPTHSAARAVRRALFVSAVTISLVAACGRDQETASSEAPGAAPLASKSVPSPSDREAAQAPAQDLPPRGSALVQRSSRGVTALANQAPLEKVLAQLQKLGGFELEIGPDVQASVPITVQGVELGLEETLAQVLRGVPYSLHYGVDPRNEGSILLRVGVGSLAEAQRPRPRLHRRQENAGAQDPEREALLAQLREQREAYERRIEERERKRRESLQQLQDPDPEVREEAARWVDTDTLQGLEAVADLLETERDPAVRAAAAEALGESNDDVTALGLLLQALEDPDPNVVIAALEAIEFAGDETTVPMLQPLLQHRDPLVRERAIEAIEFLE